MRKHQWLSLNFKLNPSTERVTLKAEAFGDAAEASVVRNSLFLAPNCEGVFRFDTVGIKHIRLSFPDAGWCLEGKEVLQVPLHELNINEKLFAVSGSSLQELTHLVLIPSEISPIRPVALKFYVDLTPRPEKTLSVKARVRDCDKWEILLSEKSPDALLKKARPVQCALPVDVRNPWRDWQLYLEVFGGKHLGSALFNHKIKLADVLSLDESASRVELKFYAAKGPDGFTPLSDGLAFKEDKAKYVFRRSAPSQEVGVGGR